MYHLLKNAAKSILGEKNLLTMEWQLRNFNALFYGGNNVYCPLCENSFGKFIATKHEEFTDHICPKCGSIARKRLLWLYLENELNAKQIGKKWLHFSPHRFLEKKMKSIHAEKYITTDYENQRADKNYDITNILEPDNKFDSIICYHVLEHIADDKKAMQELHRILKPNGTLLAQVPHKKGGTIEDLNITNPKERLEKFGQEDHVRYYGTNDFAERLQKVGFTVELIQYTEELGEEVIIKSQLNKEEVIFVCKKV